MEEEEGREQRREQDSSLSFVRSTTKLEPIDETIDGSLPRDPLFNPEHQLRSGEQQSLKPYWTCAGPQHELPYATAIMYLPSSHAPGGRWLQRSQQKKKLLQSRYLASSCCCCSFSSMSLIAKLTFLVGQGQPQRSAGERDAPPTQPNGFRHKLLGALAIDVIAQ